MALNYWMVYYSEWELIVEFWHDFLDYLKRHKSDLIRI